MVTYIKILRAAAFAVLATLSINAFSQGGFVASNISYSQTGDKTFTVNLTVYDECGSIQDLDNEASLQVFFYSDTEMNFDVTDAPTITVSKVGNISGEEVAVFCDDVITKCSGGSQRGIKKYNYTGVLDLSDYVYADDWVIWYEGFARSAQSNTAIIDDSKDAIVTEAHIITAAGYRNSSPTPNSDAFVLASMGDESTINFSSTDADGDVLVYSLANPKVSLLSSMLYKPGFDTTEFVSGSIELNPNTGDLTVESSRENEVGIVDIKVEEYRDGELIGYSTRGIQVQTFDFSNELPIISGYNDVDFVDLDNTEFTICAGEQIVRGDLYVYADDPDVDQSIGFSISPAQYVSKFQIEGDKGYFRWNTSSFDVGTHNITVSVTDNGCPKQTTSKTFTINISPQPEVNLPLGHVMNCTDGETFENFVNGGEEPLSYVWNSASLDDFNNIELGDELGTDPTYTTNTPGGYYVEVTDDAGCSDSDTIFLEDGIIPNFDEENRCEGDVTDFTDQSLTKKGSITSWDWDFDDEGATSTEQNPTYEFTSDKAYRVLLTVTNDMGCVDTVSKRIVICAPPEPFWLDDTETGESEQQCDTEIRKYTDMYDYPDECKAEVREWSTSTYFDEVELASVTEQSYPAFGLDKPQVSFGGEVYDVKVPGDTFWVELTVETEAGCVVTFKDTNWIYRRPHVDIVSFPENLDPVLIGDSVTVESFVFDCSDRDTTLHVDIIRDGNPFQAPAEPYLYEWEDKIDTDTEHFVDTIGVKQIIVTDSKKCKGTDNILISYPVTAGISYEPICVEGEAVQFRDFSTAIDGTVLDRYLWEFGDGTTSDEVEPSHVYTNPTEYTVKLTVTNENDCSDTTSITVYANTFVDRLNVLPDDVPICVSDTVIVEGPYAHPVWGSKIDTVIWNYGEGDRKYYAPDFGLPTPAGTVSQAEEIMFFFTEVDEDAPVSYSIIYNRHPEVHDSFCVYTDKKEIDVKPGLDVDIDLFRMCVGDTGAVTYERVTEAGEEYSSIVENEWKFIKNSTGEVVFSTTDEVAKPVFDQQTFHTIKLFTKDEIGCTSYDELSFTPKSIAKPSFDWGEDTVCADDGIPLKFDADNNFGVDKFWFTLNGEMVPRDTLQFSTTSYYERTYYVVPGQGEEQEIGIYFILGDEQHPCRNWTIGNVPTRGVPEVAFDWPTVCAGDVVQFTNNSTPYNDSDPITDYLWDFGDGTTSTEANPSHIFTSGGDKNVTLTANTSTGCSVEAQQDSIIYVKHKPTASFYVDIQVPEAQVDIPFIDNSETPAGIELTDSYYDFGDGVTSTEFNPFHNYTPIEKFPIEHRVTTEEGCTDTTFVTIDLNVYLELPNVFTPNGDDTNDELFLIYKSVRELYEFKIYNRWGELIFDGGNDLEARWDGTYNGVDQEIGTYVAHVKALGAYGLEFHFKRNVQLLR